MEYVKQFLVGVPDDLSDSSILSLNRFDNLVVLPNKKLSLSIEILLTKSDPNVYNVYNYGRALFSKAICDPQDILLLRYTGHCHVHRLLNRTSKLIFKYSQLDAQS
jgi:hypothetical protein